MKRYLVEEQNGIYRVFLDHWKKCVDIVVQ